MTKKTKTMEFVFFAVLGLFTIFLGDVQAQFLYEEHFENGAGVDNYPDWILNGRDDPPGQIVGQTAVVDVVDAGGGNFALLTGQNGPDSQHKVYLNLPLTRQNNVGVQFKVWGDSSQTWGPITRFPTGAGIFGPFHRDAENMGRKANDDVEAGLNWWLGVFGDLRFEEGGLDQDPDVNDGTVCGGCGTLTGPIVDQALKNAFYGADGEANAIWIRCHLGNSPANGGTGGAKVEWSPDGNNWNDVMDSVTGAVLDSRVPGYDPPPNDQDEDGDMVGYKQPPSTFEPVHVGFGTASTTTKQGSVYFDEIIVFDDLTGPPPPVGTPLPTVPPTGLGEWTDYE